MPAQNAATILKLHVPNPHSIPFTHVADWVAPVPRSQQFPPPPLKFLHTPPSPPFSSLRARELRVISIINTTHRL